MSYRLVLCVFPLLLVACASSPPKATPSPAYAACYGPTCCGDRRALEFLPHRLNCASIEGRKQGKDALAWSFLLKAIAAAGAAESTQPEAAREVLCYALNDAGHGHGERGHTDAARAAFNGSFAACRARFGEDASETAQAAYSRANFRLGQGETSTEIQDDLDIALRIAVAGKREGLHAISLDALGRQADMQGRHADGERLLLQALELKRKVYGENSIQTGTTLTNLGANAVERGELAQGAKWYQAAMQSYAVDPGPTSDRYFEVGAALASTWLAMEEDERLEPLYQDLIKATAREFGVDDERHVTLLNDYAVMLFRRGDAARAQPLFETALRVRQRTRPDELQTAWTAFNTAQASLKANGCRAARAHGQLAKDILARVDAATASAEREELAQSLRGFEQACALR